MVYIWLLIIILLILIEKFHTKTVFFTVGALLAFLLALFGINFYVQFIIFIFTGIFLLFRMEKQTIALEKKLLNKFKSNKNKLKELKQNNSPKTKGPKTNKKVPTKKGKTNGKNKKHK